MFANDCSLDDFFKLKHASTVENYTLEKKIRKSGYHEKSFSKSRQDASLTTISQKNSYNFFRKPKKLLYDETL